MDHLDIFFADIYTWKKVTEIILLVGCDIPKFKKKSKKESLNWSIVLSWLWPGVSDYNVSFHGYKRVSVINWCFCCSCLFKSTFCTTFDFCIYSIWLNSLTTNVPHHIETSQLICGANQLTGFSMIGNSGC